jgi:hypothetical protein
MGLLLTVTHIFLKDQGCSLSEVKWAIEQLSSTGKSHFAGRLIIDLGHSIQV